MLGVTGEPVGHAVGHNVPQGGLSKLPPWFLTPSIMIVRSDIKTTKECRQKDRCQPPGAIPHFTLQAMQALQCQGVNVVRPDVARGGEKSWV
jgi:hypothetical protein